MFCPQCATPRVRDDQRFCARCGTEFAVAGPAGPPGQAPPPPPAAVEPPTAYGRPAPVSGPLFADSTPRAEPAPATQHAPSYPVVPHQPAPVTYDDPGSSRRRGGVVLLAVLALVAALLGAGGVVLLLGDRDDDASTASDDRTADDEDDEIDGDGRGPRTATDSGEPDPDPSPSDPETTAAASVTCWDQTRVAELSACGIPTGSAGLTWVFASSDDATASCSQRPGATRVVEADCYPNVAGDQVRFHYSEWRSRQALQRYYEGRRVATLASPRQRADLTAWQVVARETGVGYKVAIFHTDPSAVWSVTIYAADETQYLAALEVLDIRPYRQLRGTQG